MHLGFNSGSGPKRAPSNMLKDWRVDNMMPGPTLVIAANPVRGMVQFTATAGNFHSEEIEYTWIFGNGAREIGDAVAVHVYAPGEYLAQCIARAPRDREARTIEQATASLTIAI